MKRQLPKRLFTTAWAKLYATGSTRVHNSRVVVFPRLRRFEETVLATLLWGAGGWTLNSSLVQTLTSFQLNCVKRMLNRRRRPDENYVLDQARFKHGPQFAHSWAGHVERLGPTTPIWWVTRW